MLWGDVADISQITEPYSMVGRVEDWRRNSAGLAHPLLPVSVGSASLTELPA
jgi:hypothetical protein